jgi:hypothetical protein
LANFGSFGSDDEHFSFKVAASARPTMAGAAAIQDAAAADDVMNRRRLTGVVMALPRIFFVGAAIVAAAICCGTVGASSGAGKVKAIRRRNRRT